MNTDDIIKAVGAAIAEAFGINDEQQLLQIIQNMSDEGIQKVADIITTEKDDNKKIKRIQTEVQKDIQSQKTMKAEFGAKLGYLQFLRQGHVIKTMRQDGDPGSINSTEGMTLNKKQKKMIKKHSGGNTLGSGLPGLIAKEQPRLTERKEFGDPGVKLNFNNSGDYSKAIGKFNEAFNTIADTFMKNKEIERQQELDREYDLKQKQQKSARYMQENIYNNPLSNSQKLQFNYSDSQFKNQLT